MPTRSSALETHVYTLYYTYIPETFPKTYASFGIGPLLVVEQSSLETKKKKPQGGVIKAPSYSGTKNVSTSVEQIR